MWLKPRWWSDLAIPRGARPRGKQVWRLEDVRRMLGLAHGDFARLVAMTPSAVRADLRARYGALKHRNPDAPEPQVLRELLGEAAGLIERPWSNAELDKQVNRIEDLEDISFFVVQQHRQRIGPDVFDEFTALMGLE